MGNDKIILISGPQGSGKTTLMDSLKEEFEKEGVCPINVIFADTIYKIHDFAINLLKERGISRNLVKDGKLLQLLGTEWGRQTVDENIWVKCLLGEIASIKKLTGDIHPIVFLVSDCRFRNEFDGLPNAFSIRLEASREIRKERCSQWRDNDTHPSEIDLDGYAREGKFNMYLDTEKDKTVGKVMNCFKMWSSDNSIKGMGFQKVKEIHY
jgi:energy-coupling factor transporter ATP-binding protein EcfA2